MRPSSFPAAVLACMTFLSAFLAWGRHADAAGPPTDDDHAAPCRPTIACTADLVNPGTLELEGGFIARHANTDESSRSFPFLFKLTVTKWFQVQAGSNGYTALLGPSETHFFDDASFTLKFHLLEQKDQRPSISLSGAFAVPTSNGQPGGARPYDANFIAYVSKDFGVIHADLNLGANALSLQDHPEAQGWAALALSTSIPDSPFGVMLENYYFTPAGDAASHDGGALIALSHSPKSWLVFDVGADIGYFPSAREYSAFVGFTVLPAILWR